MAVITLTALCRLLFKHPNRPPTNVKLGLNPIQNCRRKRSYEGGWGWGGRRVRGRGEGLSFQRGAAEYFTVMDVPHGDPVRDVFGARREVWGSVPPLPAPLSLRKKTEMAVPS